MAKRFEPPKSGEYTVEYMDEKHFIQKEKVRFDKGKEMWTGLLPAQFYKEHVISWYVEP